MLGTNAILLLLGVFTLAELLLAALLKLAPGLNPVEFPRVSAKLIAKHLSFHPQLGWLNPPNVTRVDNSGEHPSSYSLDSLGRRINPYGPKASLSIASYGDSFCFCREVGDDQTWQYYLARTLNAPVMNFGQGNYGFDQALMLLKKTFDQAPADIVIMAITPWSIMRILSVWKHYSEFGNILAVKPRFKLVQGELELVDNVVTHKENLMSLRKFASFFRESDYHYQHYFLRHQIRFPHTLNLLRNKVMREKLVNELILAFLYFTKQRDRINPYHIRRSEFEQNYKKDLFHRENALLKALVEDFVGYAYHKGFRPVLMLMPSYEDLMYFKDDGVYYEEFLHSTQLEIKHLLVVDLAELFSAPSAPNPATLFTRSKYGWPGHFNPEANQRIAAYLAEKLNTA